MPVLEHLQHRNNSIQKNRDNKDEMDPSSNDPTITEEGAQKQFYSEDEMNPSSDDPTITEEGVQSNLIQKSRIKKSKQEVMISSQKQLKRGKPTCFVMRTELTRFVEFYNETVTRLL